MSAFVIVPMPNPQAVQKLQMLHPMDWQGERSTGFMQHLW